MPSRAEYESQYYILSTTIDFTSDIESQVRKAVAPILSSLDKAKRGKNSKVRSGDVDKWAKKITNATRMLWARVVFLASNTHDTELRQVLDRYKSTQKGAGTGKLEDAIRESSEFKTWGIKKKSLLSGIGKFSVLDAKTQWHVTANRIAHPLILTDDRGSHFWTLTIPYGEYTGKRYVAPSGAPYNENQGYWYWQEFGAEPASNFKSEWSEKRGWLMGGVEGRHFFLYRRGRVHGDSNKLNRQLVADIEKAVEKALKPFK